jgi:hypothetical protein
MPVGRCSSKLSGHALQAKSRVTSFERIAAKSYPQPRPGLPLDFLPGLGRRAIGQPLRDPHRGDDFRRGLNSTQLRLGGVALGYRSGLLA